MLSLYEILKASKTGIAPDMWTALAGANFGGAGSGAETKELTGIPPLSIRSNGTMLLDYLISGNMSQTGTPTPTNPIQPQETGDRTGNLFDKNATYITGQTSYQYTITGLTPNQYYTCSTNFVSQGPNKEAAIYFNGGNTANNGVDVNTPKSFRCGNAGTMTIFVRFQATSQSSPPIYDDLMNGTIWIMLNEGTTPLPYQPYGYKLDIKSANTTTPVYLGEVETTRKIKKLVLTGEEDWTRTTNNKCYYINSAKGCPTDYLKSNIITVICSHYVGQTNTNSGSNEVNEGCVCFFTGGGCEMYIGETTITSAADFKSYLQQQYAAGTPVTVWYVLAKPTTGIVNEPLRKIGDYADTLSMEQAGVQIPTNRGNTVIDVDTALKPSQMYIKYQE